MTALVSEIGLSLLAILVAVIFVAMIFTFIGGFHWLDRSGK